jgi:7,8-dihydroneopterin aldolase/epimerase/oxygenase
MAATCEITLRNMQFHVRVGVLPHESEFAQPLEIDLTVRVERAMDGGIAVDYRDLHALTSDVISLPPLHYLETIADRIVAAALARPGVLTARVAVRKPHVALGGPLEHAEVVVEDGRPA